MMPPFPSSRRTFLSRAASLAAASSLRWPRLLAEGPGGELTAREAGKAGFRPLLAGATARARRYAPENDGFLIRNGRETFNRPLYGMGGFRIDAGDRPEISLFLPGHGGTLRVGVRRGEAVAKWLFECARVTTRFRAGYAEYLVRDKAVLGAGELRVEVQAAGDEAGLQMAVRAVGLPAATELLWAFGGASGRRGRGDGDLGCEEVPVSAFFQMRAEGCACNRYALDGDSATLESPAGRLQLVFPEGTRLHVAAAAAWDKGWTELARAAREDEALPVLAGRSPLGPDRCFLTIRLVPQEDLATGGKKNVAEVFAQRRRQMEALGARVRVEVADPYLPPAVQAMLLALEATWDGEQQAMLAGAVAEREVTPGWRGPCALDALGRHERMRAHLRFWLARQNQEALPPGLNGDDAMQAAADPESQGTRKASLLHTNGDLSGSQQDRNLAFFDALVRHLRWTGDAGFAREAWPALLRHMDWQYRLLRRTFANPDREARRELPLYESYACVPASENLQYNGGGVAHATAYNYFLNRATASVARLLNEDPVPFDEEAALLAEAMQQLLWQPARGAFAEARDAAAPGTVFSNPALWTVSRTLDAELPTPRQAWQMCAERMAALRRIPVEGEEVPAGGFLLPSSDWTLAEPALNRLAMAEGVHFALALWQAGMADEAYALLKGNLLDSMYQGACPGNFHVTSALDPHRGETQRDAADPLGITARALVEGLFGVLPDMMRGTLTIRPGFPSDWTEARLLHPEVEIVWKREGLHESFTITSRLPQPVALTLVLPARSTADPVVLSNGKAYPFTFDPNATGTPRLVLTNFPPGTAWQIEVRWRGKPPTSAPTRATYRVGEPIVLPAPLTADRIDDPQGCLSNGVARSVGQHAVFVHVVEEKCGFWLPIPLEIVPAIVTKPTAPPAAERYEPVKLAAALDGRITDLLSRSYLEPRSSFCSLALPEHLLGGWTDSDVRFEIDDAGLRGAGGVLTTAYGIPFVTPADRERANCRFLSFWKGDAPWMEQPLSGRASTLYLLLTGTTFPQANRVEHGAVTVRYMDGSESRLSLRAPETWWPVQRDYQTDDYLLVMDPARPLPPRVDLRTGRTRVLEQGAFKGKGGAVPGGAATVLHLPLHPERELAAVRVECSLYGVVVALLGMTLGR